MTSALVVDGTVKVWGKVLGADVIAQWLRSPRCAVDENWLEAHRGAVRARALRWAENAADAEDLAQEALLRAHRRIGTLRDPAAALAWLLRIVDRIAIDRRRRWDPLRAPAGDPDGEAAGRASSAPTGLEMAEQEEMGACTRKYLEELRPQHRRVLWLHDVEGRSAREMAQILGISEGAAKIRLHRARESLRELLTRACRFSRDERGVFVCEPAAAPPGEQPSRSRIGLPPPPVLGSRKAVSARPSQRRRTP